MRARSRGIFLLLPASMLLLSCATTLEPVRPVEPAKEHQTALKWPEYVTAADIALLGAAEKRIDDVRKGELLVQVVDVAGWPVEGVEVRWVQEARDFQFGVQAPFEPNAWGQLLRMGVNHAAAQLDWQSTEPASGLWTAGATAAAWAVDILPAMGVSQRGAALVWLEKQNSPDWVRQTPAAELAALVDEHVRALAHMLTGHVALWEALTDPAFESPEDLVRVARASTLALRDADPTTPIMVRFKNLLGEGRIGSPIEITRRLLDADIDFDVLGVDLRYNGYSHAAIAERRSLAQMQEGLSDLALHGKPIHITAASVPSAPHPDDVKRAGHWARRWSPELQAVYARALYVMLFSHPAVEAITWEGAFDTGTETVAGGLLNKAGTPRPAFHALADLLREWRTEGGGKVDADGQLRFRGFGGTYRVIVTDPVSRREVSTTAHITERQLEKRVITLPRTLVQPIETAVPWSVVRR